MNTSIKKIFDFITVAKKYKTDHREETKLLYAINKVLPKAEKCIIEYWDLQEDINIEFANTDANGSILYTTNPNGTREYQYKKEDIKPRDLKSKALLNDREFEVEEHIVSDIPEGFNEEYRQYFTGFVISE